ADARRPHRLAAAGLPARHPLALAPYRRLGQDRGARRIDLLVCAADAADVPRAAGAAAPRRRLLDSAARLLRADLRALPADGMGARQIRFHTLSRRRAGSGSASQFHHEHRRQWRARVLLYRAGRPFMLRTLSAALAVAVMLSLAPAAPPRRRLFAGARPGGPGRAGGKPGPRDEKAHRAQEAPRPPPLARLRLP